MTPLIMVVIIAFALSLLTQVVNKLLINEKKTDENNKKMKDIQAKLKGLDPKSHEFAKMQEEVLDISMLNMRQQFKPLLITLIPFILVLNIMTGMYAYAPIETGSTLKVTASGNGLLDIPCLGINETITKSFSNMSVFSQNCNGTINGVKTAFELTGKTKMVNLQAENMKVYITPPKLVFISLPFTIPFIGNTLGWLGIYIITSFACSMILNKALKGIYFRKWQ